MPHFSSQACFPYARPRRLRANASIRALLQEHRLHPSDLIAPLFIHHRSSHHAPIVSMPGCEQIGTDALPAKCEELVAAGIQSVILFGLPEHKDEEGRSACTTDAVIPQAIQAIKRVAPQLWVIADLCCCEYTTHGHCGVLNRDRNDVDNDATLQVLAEQAVVLAEAGVDCVAPSAMMDGMVQAIRQALDSAGHQSVAMLSYAVKYASAFYGPFRDAADGAPSFGDRQSYQMQVANGNEALQEAALDVAEGADLLMVKPAMLYGDIIHQLTQAFPEVPVLAYQVSGEYAMLKAASQNGALNESHAVLESLLSLKRSGARCIITYYALQAAKWLRQEQA